MRRIVVVLALVVALSGLTALTAPLAHAACRQPAGPGAPLPAAAGQEPLINRLGLRRVWELTKGRGVTVSVVDSGVDARHPKLARGRAAGRLPRHSHRRRVRAGARDGRRLREPRHADRRDHRGPCGRRRAGAGDRTGGEDCAGAVRRLPGPGAHRDDRRRHPRRGRPGRRAEPVVRGGRQRAGDREGRAVRGGPRRGRGGGGRQRGPVATRPDLVSRRLRRGARRGRGRRRRAAGPRVEPGAVGDIAAPGEGLTAPSSGGEGFVAVKGTSFATAVVSGVAALVRARFPDMPADEVVQRIEATAVSPSGGRDHRTGAGIVDPYLAVTAEAAGAAVAPPAGETRPGRSGWRPFPRFPRCSPPARRPQPPWRRSCWAARGGRDRRGSQRPADLPRAANAGAATVLRRTGRWARRRPAARVTSGGAGRLLAAVALVLLAGCTSGATTPAGPPTVDPPTVDPHAVDPHAVDPHAVDPHAVDPHAVDPLSAVDDPGRRADLLQQLAALPRYEETGRLVAADPVPLDEQVAIDTGRQALRTSQLTAQVHDRSRFHSRSASTPTPTALSWRRPRGARRCGWRPWRTPTRPGTAARPRLPPVAAGHPARRPGRSRRAPGTSDQARRTCRGHRSGR